MDNRYLIGSGFVIFGWCAWWMSNLTLGYFAMVAVVADYLSGVGTGLMFVPLSTTAVGTLRNEQIGNASGLFNLLRNIGGSVGISVVDTLVARRQQVHRSELAVPGAHMLRTLRCCFGFKRICRCTPGQGWRSCAPMGCCKGLWISNPCFILMWTISDIWC